MNYSKKKNYQRRKTYFETTDEKVSAFIEYLGDDHELLKQYSRDDMIQAFKDGLRSHRYLASVYKRFLTSFRMTQNSNLMKDNSNFEKVVVEWTDWNEHSLGHLFINKFKANASTSFNWKPPGFNTAGPTELLLFEDVYRMKGLEWAILLDDKPPQNLQEFLVKFPPTCDISIVCPKTELKIFQREHEFLKMQFCPLHGCKIAPTVCCDIAREYSIYHPKNSSQFSVRGAFLRYNQFVRIIISSASLLPTHWSKTAQLGWFIDLPIRKKTGSDMTKGNLQFQNDLFGFIEKCGVPSNIFNAVDFSIISPAVQLTFSLPDHHDVFPLKQLMSRIRPLHNYWIQEHIRPEARVCTVKLGSSAANKPCCLDTMLNFPNMFTNFNNTLKIIYPSEKFVRERESEIDTSLCDLFTNNDKACLKWPYLYNPDSNVVCACNYYYQYADIKIEESTKRMAWLHIGNQSLSFGSWGHVPKLLRYELGVTFVPVTREAGIEVVDFSNVSLPVVEPTAYSEFDSPLMGKLMKDYELFCLLGEVTVERDCFFFLNNTLEPKHPLNHIYQQYPTNYPIPNAAVLKKSTLLSCGFREMPQMGSIVAFWHLNYKHLTVDRDSKQRRALADRVIAIFNSIDEALVYHKSHLEKIGVQTQFDHLEIPAYRRDCKEFLEKHGENEEEYDRYWSDQWCQWWTTDVLQISILDAKQMEESYPMNTMKCPDDMTFLENHVKKTCNGRTPTLIGPYTLKHLEAVTRVCSQDYIID